MIETEGGVTEQNDSVAATRAHGGGGELSVPFGVCVTPRALTVTTVATAVYCVLTTHPSHA